MNPIPCTLAALFLLISLALLLLFRLNPFSVVENPLKNRRLILAGTKLKITERIALHFAILFRQTRCSKRKFFILLLLSAAGGFTAGLLLFSNAGLAAVMAVCVLPVPYFYLTVRNSAAAREEIEGLENTMSIITNAYAGNDDIIKAVELYVAEKNRYIPVQRLYHLLKSQPYLPPRGTGGRAGRAGFRPGQRCFLPTQTADRAFPGYDR